MSPPPYSPFARLPPTPTTRGIDQRSEERTRKKKERDLASSNPNAQSPFSATLSSFSRRAERLLSGSEEATSPIPLPNRMPASAEQKDHSSPMSPALQPVRSSPSRLRGRHEPRSASKASPLAALGLPQDWLSEDGNAEVNALNEKDERNAREAEARKSGRTVTSARSARTRPLPPSLDDLEDPPSPSPAPRKVRQGSRTDDVASASRFGSISTVSASKPPFTASKSTTSRGQIASEGPGLTESEEKGLVSAPNSDTSGPTSHITTSKNAHASNNTPFSSTVVQSAHQSARSASHPAASMQDSCHNPLLPHPSPGKYRNLTAVPGARPRKTSLPDSVQSAPGDNRFAAYTATPQHKSNFNTPTPVPSLATYPDLPVPPCSEAQDTSMLPVTQSRRLSNKDRPAASPASPGLLATTTSPRSTAPSRLPTTTPPQVFRTPKSRQSDRAPTSASSHIMLPKASATPMSQQSDAGTTPNSLNRFAAASSRPPTQDYAQNSDILSQRCRTCNRPHEADQPSWPEGKIGGVRLDFCLCCIHCETTQEATPEKLWVRCPKTKRPICWKCIRQILQQFVGSWLWNAPAAIVNSRGWLVVVAIVFCIGVAAFWLLSPVILTAIHLGLTSSDSAGAQNFTDNRTDVSLVKTVSNTVNQIQRRTIPACNALVEMAEGTILSFYSLECTYLHEEPSKWDFYQDMVDLVGKTGTDWNQRWTGRDVERYGRLEREHELQMTEWLRNATQTAVELAGRFETMHNIMTSYVETAQDSTDAIKAVLANPSPWPLISGTQRIFEKEILRAWPEPYAQRSVKTHDWLSGVIHCSPVRKAWKFDKWMWKHILRSPVQVDLYQHRVADLYDHLSNTTEFQNALNELRGLSRNCTKRMMFEGKNGEDPPLNGAQFIGDLSGELCRLASDVVQRGQDGKGEGFVREFDDMLRGVLMKKDMK